MKLLLCFAILALNFYTGSAGQSLGSRLINIDTVGDLEQLQIIGRGTFSAADISPDGETLAVGTTAGVWFYELDDLTAEPVYQQYGTGFTSNVRFDATGAYLEVTNYYPDVGGYSTGLLQLDEALNVAGSIDSVRLSNDRRYILYEDDSMFDIRTNADIQIDFPVTDIFEPNPSTAIMHPDQPLVAVKANLIHPAGRALELQLYDRSQNRYIASLQTGFDYAEGGFERLVFSEDGEWLIGVVTQHIPTYNATVYRWSIADLIQNEVTQYDEGHLIWASSSAGVNALHAFNDRVIITSQTSDPYEQTIEVFDLLEGTVQERLQGIYGVIHPVTGDLIAFETTNGDRWTLTNITQDKIMGALDNFDGRVWDMVFNVDETQMLSINQRIDANVIRAFVHLRNTTTWESNSTLYLDNQITTRIGFQPDGRPIAVSAVGREAESQKRVDIWDVEAHEILYSFQMEVSPSITLSENGQYLFMAEGGNRWLYDIGRPQSPVSISLPDNELVTSVGFFDPMSRYLTLIEVEDNSYLLRLWDISQQAEVSRITNRWIVLNRFAHNVQFVKDGELMVLCELRNSRGADYQMTFWQFEDLLTQTFPSPYMTVSDAMLCRLDYGDRHNVVVPTYGEGIQEWSTLSSNINARSEGDEWWRVAKFGPDGTVVFGIDYYGEMTAWDASDMSELVAFKVSQWQVNRIDFIQDGTIMVLPANDGTIRIWGIPTSD
jgi:WD40 repeat protein